LFMHMTEEQDELLRQQGEREATLLGKNPTQLKPPKLRIRRRQNAAAAAAVGGGGFGEFGSGGFGAPRGGGGKNKHKKTESKDDEAGSSSSSSPPPLPSDAMFRERARELAKFLRKDGIVRIDGVLTMEQAAELREYAVDLRSRATYEVETGAVQDSQRRFADVLLNQNRCDLKLPLGPNPVNRALHSILTRSPIPALLQEAFDDANNSERNDAVLYEWNCFMSNAGARRQLLHADSVMTEPLEGIPEEEPIMLTCFIALQDIDPKMGPTVFLPGTNTVRAHRQFFETSPAEFGTKEDLLRKSKAVVGTLPAGSCAVFDPRTIHCAGANTYYEDPDHTRAIAYCSFKNPKIDFPGCPSTAGYGIPTSEWTVSDLAKVLEEVVTSPDRTKSSSNAKWNGMISFP